MRNNTRREFLKTTAATGIGFWVAGGLRAQESRSPNEKIAMAAVGVDGKGASDSADAGAVDLLLPQKEAQYHLPATIGGFTDFFTSLYHTERGGRVSRPDNPVPPNFPPACRIVRTTSTVDLFSCLFKATGMPRPLSATVTVRPFLCNVTTISSACPFIASSTELSKISQTK